MTDSEKIKEIRKALDMTQAEFAERLNVTQAQVSSLEKGTRKLNSRTIKDICREFDINEKYLTNEQEEMFIKQVQDDELIDVIKDCYNSLDDYEKKTVNKLLRKIMTSI